MNSCQVEPVEEAIKFTLLPFYSHALSQIPDRRFSILVLHPQTVIIRAVSRYESYPFLGISCSR
jgi:hypothetical protein